MLYITDSITRIHVSSESFCKTTDKLNFNVRLRCNFTFVSVKFSISLSSQCSGYVLVKFRHKKHLVRARKTSDLFWLPQSWTEMV